MNQKTLPNLEDKKYKTISEVSRELAIEQHVLRFWETKFPELNPKKIRGRRYYSTENIAEIIRVRDLLYNQGYSIDGAVKAMKNVDTRSLIDKSELYKIIMRLKGLRNNLSSL